MDILLSFSISYMFYNRKNYVFSFRTPKMTTKLWYWINQRQQNHGTYYFNVIYIENIHAIILNKMCLMKIYGFVSRLDSFKFPLKMCRSFPSVYKHPWNFSNELYYMKFICFEVSFQSTHILYSSFVTAKSQFQCHIIYCQYRYMPR